jgi:hypothetical protein
MADVRAVEVSGPLGPFAAGFVEHNGGARLQPGGGAQSTWDWRQG